MAEALPPHRNLTDRTIVAVLWSSSGTIVQFISNITVMVILARLLTPTDFGLISGALLAIIFCQTLGELGVGYVIVQRPVLSNKHIETGFTLALLSSLVLTGVAALLAPLVAWFFHNESLTPVLRILSLTILLKGLGFAAEGLLRRDLNFKSLATIQIVSFSLGYGLTSIVLAWLGLGVWALVGAQLIQTTVELLLFLIARPHSKRLTLDKASLQDFFNFGSGATLGKLIHYFAVQGDNMVVGRGLGAEALGFYGRAYRLMALPANLLGDAVEAVLLSTMSKLQDDNKRLVTIYQNGMALTALAIMPVSALAFVLAPEIILIALGPQWGGAIVPLRFLSIGMFFRAGYKISGTLVYSKGRIYWHTVYQALYAILVLSATLIGVRFGLAGVSMGVTVALALYYFSQLYFGSRLVKLSVRQLLPIFVPAIATTIITLGVAWVAADVLRRAEQSAIVVALVTFSAVAGCLVPLVFFMPGIFLGKEGVWWLSRLGQYLPFRVKLAKPL